MVIIFFQECRCDTVSQECEFLETLKYSSHHCETPKSTEIVKIAIFSGFSDFRSFWAWLHVRNFQICDFQTSLLHVIGLLLV